MVAPRANAEGGDVRDELQDSQAQAKALLINIITKKCTSSSHLTLKQINDAINNGSKLKAELVSGGFTNYSYKVWVDTNKHLCVSAKIAFQYAQYNLQRTENEFLIMKTISGENPDGCVVTPIACWDMNISTDGQKMKLLLTEWSEATEEQFANQFADGHVDPRIAPKIASTLAELHTMKDFDPSFNNSVKPNMEGFLLHMKMVALLASHADEPMRRTDAYCSQLGPDTVLKIIDAVIADYGKRECLIHSESHAFNILVEAKPSIEMLEEFGPKGTCVIDDWEMAMAGPQGKDIGLALAYPIGCMISHALNGHDDANVSIEIFINTLIDTYLAKMTEAGKSEEERTYILRNIVGWTGWFQYFTFFILDVFYFPVEEQASKTRLRDALGVLGFKLLRLSYDTDYFPMFAKEEDIRKKFNSLWRKEVKRARDAFASGKRRRQPRKSSLWRTDSSRRLSGTEMLYLTAERRLSSVSVGDSMRRLSVSGKSGSIRNLSDRRRQSGSKHKSSIGDSIEDGVESIAESLRRESIALGIGDTMKSIPEGLLTEEDAEAVETNYDDYLSFLSEPKQLNGEEEDEDEEDEKNTSMKGKSSQSGKKAWKKMRPFSFLKRVAPWGKRNV
ncbi:hypothetical protein ACHAXR_007354 [Thalassiosira sp. AJA248-18]